MIELAEILYHVRLLRSPPLGVRAVLGGISGVLAIAVLGLLFRFVRSPSALATALGDDLPDGVSRPWLIGVFGAVVGIVFELLVAAGESIRPRPPVLFSEVTLVDLGAWAAVSAGLVVGGAIVLRVHNRPSLRVYSQWIVVSIVVVGLTLWMLLIVYEILGLAGLL